MSDPRLTERYSAGERGLSSRENDPSLDLPEQSGSFRIDAPHQLGDAPADDRPDLLTQSFCSPGTSPDDLAEDRILTQAEQISEYLRAKQLDLDQREERLLTQLAQIDQERRSVRMWVVQSEEELDEKQSQLETREREVFHRESRCRQIEAEVEQDRIELLQSRAELEIRQERVEQAERRLEMDLQTIRAQKEEEWEAHRQEMQAAIEEQRMQLEVERDDLRSGQEQKEAELRQERQLLENRIRFQLDHLEKMRGEVEEQQREFLIEHQGLTTRNQHERHSLHLRKRQLLRFRGLLEEREKSLDRSWDSFFKTQKAFADSCQETQARLELEQRAWAREQEHHQGEIRRQHELLTAHAENLEARHLRLDELRLELEATHRQLLEMRVAIEESTAQLAQAIGEAGARERINQARRGISEHYQKSNEALLVQRREIEQLRAGLQQQREDFHRERETMTDWVKERDDLLTLREVSIRKGEEELTVREAAWQKLREFWQSEKLQAERIIRDLLRQLEDKAGLLPESPLSTDFDASHSAA